MDIIFPSQRTDLFNPSAIFQTRLCLWLLHPTCLLWHLEKEPPFKKEKKELAGGDCWRGQQPALPAACALPRNLLRSRQLLAPGWEMWK